MGAAAIPDLLRALQIAPAVAPFRPLLLETIGLIGDQRAFNPLVRELNSAVWMIQAEACVALGRIGDPAALPELEKLTRQPELSPGTQAGLSYALYLLGKKEELETLLALASPESIQTINWGFTQYALSLLRQTVRSPQFRWGPRGDWAQELLFEGRGIYSLEGSQTGNSCGGFCPAPFGLRSIDPQVSAHLSEK